ncbi:MAG TPA: cyclic pyranopterin monophosphate synthase MoaC [Candidatus Nanopelagicaceae bacterium]|nr:cyclic pyranopterin monophosphate synthase MoaC [Candidatus Nanopelagicaceae bacterium]
MTAPERSEGELTHLDRQGRVSMVDVGDRPISDREATATGFVRVSDRARAAIAAGTLSKGDVLEVCRVAGIMAAKRTPELIPLCHPISISHVSVEADLDPDGPLVKLRATVRCRDATGVEMEALTAVAVAGLTVIDMIKSVDPWAEIGGIGMESKSGGRSGSLRRPDRSLAQDG